jgi:putative endonuclease
MPDPFGGAWFVYIVRCADGSLYTGATNRLLMRINMHNTGRGAKYTRGRGPVHLVWSKIIGSKSEALKAEARIKKLSRSKKEEILPWHSPTKQIRNANVMLREHAKLCPPPPEGVDTPLGFFTIMALSGTGWVDVREKLVHKYAWATPTETALGEILSHGPIVEMGAGSGYWAWLLQMLGGDVKAYDRFAEGRVLGINPWSSNGETWTEVQYGTPSKLRKHSDRTLFLCWPPHESDMANRCLKYWKGETLICTGDRNMVGDEKFHTTIFRKFKLLKSLPLPTWPGIKDGLEVWKRKR